MKRRWLHVWDQGKDFYIRNPPILSRISVNWKFPDTLTTILGTIIRTYSQLCMQLNLAKSNLVGYSTNILTPLNNSWWKVLGLCNSSFMHMYIQDINEQCVLQFISWWSKNPTWYRIRLLDTVERATKVCAKWEYSSLFC